ncbi:hypothetical protein [Saccharospirillum mangrovi]|uniref:hypothetical protein n=1 Tax=Saccharospirillum mangrovi TaxID=2161747 RepID=UPI000D363C70|nr:hypothetical protein [Saccharospirillum mangrovi]
MVIAELLKFIGVCLSAFAAIFSIKTEGIKSVNSGKLTTKGRIIVSMAVFGVLLSGGAQLTQIFDAVKNSQEMSKRQEQIVSRLENATYQVTRQYYPLEPLTIQYEIQYTMDQPRLQGYTNRVEKSILTYLREIRNNPGETIENLTGEPNFIISNVESWTPNPENEMSAFSVLFEDHTQFIFTQSDDSEISFMSISKEEEGIYVQLPARGPPIQTLEVLADFNKRVFIKKVESKNPIRTGNDIFANSALDLVGRQMTWQSGMSWSGRPDPIWDLIEFSLIFPYDYEIGARVISLETGITSYNISPEDIGMADVFNNMNMHRKSNIDIN